MEETEKWRELPVLDGRYRISSFGRIFSRRGRKNLKCTELKQFNNSLGYMQVNLMGDDGREHKKYVHRLVAFVFLPNPQNLPEVNHKDGNRANNRASNLEWISRKDNMIHSVRALGHKNLGLKPKKVEDTSTGEIFGSVKEVASRYSVKTAKVYNQMHGRVKDIQGHTFKLLV